VKERPILFSGPMVRAILSGRKTVTRRVMKPQPRGIWGSGVARPGNILGVRSDAFHVHANVQGDHRFLYCPYGAPGDRLWVRETWSPYADEYTKGYCQDADAARGIAPRPAVYRADHSSDVGIVGLGGDGRWRPSIHMPRWASRITLEVTGVRVERLQEITEEGALAEGVRGVKLGHLDPEGDAVAHRTAFVELWDGLNAARGFGWYANPWVWVVEFRRVS
jgi:hypothetical protein